MNAPLRVGNAQGFWGDRGEAPAELLAAEPELDALTLDYLAEVSLSILARQRDKDPSLGYARDFVEVVRALAPYWKNGGQCRLIANSGGLNPTACAEACAAALREAGAPALPIGVVAGDDVIDDLKNNPSDAHFQNLETGASLETIVDRLETANAYLGAAGIVEALDRGARIVITGRVADPSLTVAAAIHHYGWNADAFDRIAGATVAGHLIECGAQLTGGIATDWLDLPEPQRIGFPIVEIAEDGSCVVTKQRDSGGVVNQWTVKEQLLYEIGDPGRYLSPDATVSFLGLRVEETGANRVRVTGARGSPAPPAYKVSATYRDGFRAQGMLTIHGRDAEAKARRCGAIVLERLKQAGFEPREATIECLGTGDAVPLDWAPRPSGPREVVLRIAVEDDRREAVERFSKSLMPLVTAGPQGTTGYAEGRPRVHPVFRYWPCRIPRDQVQPRVTLLTPETAL